MERKWENMLEDARVGAQMFRELDSEYSDGNE